MNEFIELLRIVAKAGWAYLGLLFVVSVGFLLFDRRPRRARRARSEEAAESKRRLAA